MNILIFSSSMPEGMFSSYQDQALIKPNPSNQNFYNRLIKALALNNNVSVISHRPFVKGMFRRKALESDMVMDGNVKYYLTQIRGERFYKLFQEKFAITKAAKQAINDFVSNDFIIITDTLRLNLLKTAKKVAKKYVSMC